MKRLSMKRLFVAAAAVVVALAAAAPAAATTAWFSFARQSNLNSTLTLNWEPMPGKFSTISWRAGSGYGGNGECVVGAGWLPAGWYDLWGHWDHYEGSKIKGRVFYLQDKRCWNGTLRSELFIHSEETADQGQYCPSSYDDPFCWEGDFDYASSGCIKVAHAQPYPSDIALAHQFWHEKSGDYRHGSFWMNDFLYVY
jgi:hypothetical protein